MNIKTVDPNTLIDINDVTIDMNQPKEQRLSSYLNQIKNPYLFRCGEYVVRLKFAQTEATLKDKLNAYVRSTT